MKADDRAPSPRSRRNRLGIWKARKKASATGPVPMKAA
jgi:hypothetical protein